MNQKRTLRTRESPRTRKIGMKVHKDQPYRKKPARTKKARRSKEPKAQAFQPTLPTKIHLDDTDRAHNSPNVGSQEDKFELDPSEEEFQPQIVDNIESQKENYREDKHEHDVFDEAFQLENIGNYTPQREKREVIPPFSVSKPTSSTTPNSDYQSTVGTPIDTPVKLSKPRYQLAQFRIEYPKEVLATLHSDPEGSINSFVTNLEDGGIITDVMKEVIKIPPRPSEAEKAAGGGDTGNDTTNNSDKSSIGSDGSQVNRTTQETTNVEKRQKSSQQKALSDREFKTPPLSCGKGQNEKVAQQDKPDAEVQGEKGLKKRRMSPEEADGKTEEYYKRSKIKVKEVTPPKQCACGGTALKHKYLLHAEDYTKKYMCVGTIMDTVKEYGINLITEKEHDRIQKVIETNEKFNSQYCIEDKQMEIVENNSINERQNTNLAAGKQKTPQLIQNKDLIEAGPSRRGNTDFSSQNSQTEETSGHTDRDKLRGKQTNRSKWKNASDREEALQQTKDEYNEIEEDIKNEARKLTNKAVLKRRDSYVTNRVDDLPYTAFAEGDTNIIYRHYYEKLKKNYRSKREEITAKMRLLDSPTRNEKFTMVEKKRSQTPKKTNNIGGYHANAVNSDTHNLLGEPSLGIAGGMVMALASEDAEPVPSFHIGKPAGTDFTNNLIGNFSPIGQRRPKIHQQLAGYGNTVDSFNEYVPSTRFNLRYIRSLSDIIGKFETFRIEKVTSKNLGLSGGETQVIKTHPKDVDGRVKLEGSERSMKVSRH
ncbi:hypothetical protein JTB14_037698 [Gonioctena quinquepunctata]|nr:hypothetical protein JTB14_037698 [Gonioctena quinquepunctata]